MTILKCKIGKSANSHELISPSKITDAGLSVDAVGVAGESVRVCAAHGMDKVCQDVHFTDAGKKTVNFSSQMMRDYPVPNIEIVH